MNRCEISVVQACRSSLEQRPGAGSGAVKEVIPRADPLDCKQLLPQAASRHLERPHRRGRTGARQISSPGAAARPDRAAVGVRGAPPGSQRCSESCTPQPRGSCRAQLFTPSSFAYRPSPQVRHQPLLPRLLATPAPPPSPHPGKRRSCASISTNSLGEARIFTSNWLSLRPKNSTSHPQVRPHIPRGYSRAPGSAP